MRSKTIIVLRWVLSGRIEVFHNLGKLYLKYPDDMIGITRHGLSKKNLKNGYHNSTVEVYKLEVDSPIERWDNF